MATYDATSPKKCSNEELEYCTRPSFMVVGKLSVADVTGVDSGIISLVNSNCSQGNHFFRKLHSFVCRALQMLASLATKLRNDTR